MGTLELTLTDSDSSPKRLPDFVFGGGDLPNDQKCDLPSETSKKADLNHVFLSTPHSQLPLRMVRSQQPTSW